MTLNRRDVIKYASAAGFIAALPATERAAAMRALEVPVSDNPTLDPASFATNGHNLMSNDDDIWYSSIAPEEWAEFQRARNDLEALVPAMKDHSGHRAIWDAATELENTLLTLINASHWAGLRHGARYEHLRQSLVSDRVECRNCWGVGSGNGRTCTTCAGAGMVAFADGRHSR